MSSSKGNHTPEDTQTIVSLMNDLGIHDYDQQVINHLLEFNYRYTTHLLEESKACSAFADKDIIDASDVRMAIQLAQDGIFRKPLSRDELCKVSSELNKIPLPAIKPASGLRIPQDGSSFLQTNYRLKTDLTNSKKVLKKDTKTTAVELLVAARQTEAGSNDDNATQSDLKMDDLTDLDFDEVIGNQQDNQDNSNDFNLDSLLHDPNLLPF